VRGAGLDEREDLAIALLVGVSSGIQLSDDLDQRGHIDGQHRVAAQLDQGVKQTGGPGHARVSVQLRIGTNSAGVLPGLPDRL